MPVLLIVDADDIDRQKCSAYATRAGLETLACADGESALRALEDQAEHVCAALISWELPGALSGGRLIAAIHVRMPALPLVVTSATLELDGLLRAKAAGAAEWLKKPLDAHRVVETIRQLLRPPDPPDPLLRNRS